MVSAEVFRKHPDSLTPEEDDQLAEFVALDILNAEDLKKRG